MKKILILFFVLGGYLVFAATNIDSSCKYAWSGSIGWINFGCDYCNVQVLDDKIIGYAWSQNYGWINLAPSNGGILNDGQGNLSGYAWGENLGWIDFSNVKIDPNTGNFTGYALILIYASSTDEMRKIVFQGDNFCLKTSWRPFVETPSVSRPIYSGGEKVEEKKEEILSQDILQVLLNLINQSLSKPSQITEKEIEKEIGKEKITRPSIEEKIYIVKEEMPLPFRGNLKITYTQKNLDLTLFTTSPYKVNVFASVIRACTNCPMSDLSPLM